jgi:hypothetical protein
MEPHVTLSWSALDVTVRCTLLDDVNPQLCASLRRALPIVSVQTHAVVAGEQMYFPTRLVLDDPDSATTEDLSAQPPGRVNFDPFFQYLSVNYGRVSERVPAWPVAQVMEEDLPRLPRVGHRIWQNLLHEDHAVHVIVSPSDAPAGVPPGELRAFAPPEPALDAPELTAFLSAETDRIWLFEPRDALDLRTGRAPTRAGVGGQYFSPWVMATGLVRGLSVVDLPALRRFVSSEKLGVRAAADLLAELLRVPAGVIGYFGLPELGAVLEVVRASCPRLVDREELRRLLDAFGTYLNRYNLWLHQGFPWRLGDRFRRE